MPLPLRPDGRKPSASGRLGRYRRPWGRCTGMLSRNEPDRISHPGRDGRRRPTHTGPGHRRPGVHRLPGKYRHPCRPAENDGTGRIFASHVVVGPDKSVESYRKLHVAPPKRRSTPPETGCRFSTSGEPPSASSCATMPTFLNLPPGWPWRERKSSSVPMHRPGAMPKPNTLPGSATFRPGPMTTASSSWPAIKPAITGPACNFPDWPWPFPPPAKKLHPGLRWKRRTSGRRSRCQGPGKRPQPRYAVFLPHRRPEIYTGSASNDHRFGSG